jgi:apolipoprotein N-acyltransferase
MCLVAGAAAALAFPPFGFLPGLLGYGLLMHLIERPSVAEGGTRLLKSAFLAGWLAGLAFFAIGVWWVAEAFLVDAVHQGWMAPFAVILLAGGLALFWGLGAVLYVQLKGRSVWRAIIFAGCFAAAEWLRGHLLTGFPWNLPGETFRAGSALSQGAALMGSYGMTWLVLAVSAGLTLLREGRKGLVAASLAALSLAGLFGYGQVRLHHAAAPLDGAPIVRIVQANVPQSAKYDEAMFYDIVSRYTRLTPSPGKPADLVIWPEGALPTALEDYLAPGTWTREAIARALTPDQTLIVGGYRQENARYYNSLLALHGPQLTVQGRYDKYRLVPFGEFLPLEPLWGGVKQLVAVGDGFSPGPPPAAMSIGKGLPLIQPLICYESLFPGFTREGARRTGQRAHLIVNISNDAWFGATSGPLQHLNLASYRAIEEGLPLVRATPTGVSAIVDAYGRTVPARFLGPGKMVALEGSIPPSLPSTLYSAWGNTLFLVLLFLSSSTVLLIDGRQGLRSETWLTQARWRFPRPGRNKNRNV